MTIYNMFLLLKSDLLAHLGDMLVCVDVWLGSYLNTRVRFKVQSNYEQLSTTHLLISDLIVNVILSNSQGDLVYPILGLTHKG